MGATKERRIVTVLRNYLCPLAILGVLILGALGFVGWAIVIGYAIGLCAKLHWDIIQMAASGDQINGDEILKMIPADVLKRIDEALEDIDNGIFPTDGIPADEALRRWQDVAANAIMEKDDES